MVQENYVPAHLNSLWFLASDTQEARKYAADYHFSLGNFEAALDCSLLIIESTMCAVLFRDVADVALRSAALLGRWDVAESLLERLSPTITPPKLAEEWKLSILVGKELTLHALILVQDLLATQPLSPTLWNSVAICFSQMGRPELSALVSTLLLQFGDPTCRIAESTSNLMRTLATELPGTWHLVKESEANEDIELPDTNF